ncbi:MAG: PP2C family serine/threonine-protein phosphatase [Lachnospiraceae bacterium]|nr:PP2C family serine/threonine-protein phosphatase [Lachnospiraceae bacterium]
MRKYSSSMKTAFVSEAGSKLTNKDYFGFVELDNFACYVIADGITDRGDGDGARTAIEAIIQAFQEDPGIGKGRIKGYLKQANEVLLKGEGDEKLKASLTVVITDYVKLRFGYVGNTRFRIYRQGRCYFATTDMSLSQDMVHSGEVREDKASRHEERNNLYAYLGQKSFHPFVSTKVKLLEGDILTLYTRGIWEQVDEGELLDVFSEAGNDPAEECDKVEELLLSRQPKELENYTFAAIYVEKVFQDPNRKRKIKGIIRITVVVLILLLVVGLLLFFWQKGRREKREEMELAFTNVETYIEDSNYTRAKEECDKALKLAGELKDKEEKEKYNQYLISLEAIIVADEAYDEGDYIQAKEDYLKARVRVKYADNLGLAYIEKRLEQITAYEQVFDQISLGDRLLEYENYTLAEEKYLEAKEKASSIYFKEGKQQALDALDKLYEAWSEVQAKEEEANQERAAEEVAAAQLVAQAKKAYQEQDYEGAMVFYLMAIEKYEALEDQEQAAALEKQMSALEEKQAQVAARVEEAKAFREQARILEEEKKYALAIQQYQYAKAIYDKLDKTNEADEIQGKIDLITSKLTEAEKAAAKEAEEAAKKAQEEQKAEEAAKKAQEAAERAEEAAKKAEEERKKQEQSTVSGNG